MIKKTFSKNIFRDIRSSLTRFIAIFAITALGAGFYTGLKSSGPDMLNTADKYYSDSHLMDYRVLSPIGFDDDDINALRRQEDIANVMPTYGIDVLAESNGGTNPVRLNTLPADVSDQNDDYLNRLVLLEGTLPQTPKECVADSAWDGAIGDTVTISDDNQTETLDMLKEKTFTVVGVAESPYYITTNQRGNTNIGNGTIAEFYYVNDTAFDTDYYTDVYIKAKNTADLSSFSDAYEKRTDDGVKKLEALGEKQAGGRFDDIVSEATEKLTDGKKQLADGTATLYREKVDALAELRDAKQAIIDGEREIISGKRLLAENAQKLQDGQKEYDDGVKELQANEAVLRQSQAKIDSGWAELNARRKEYEEGLAQYQQLKALYDSGLALIDRLQQWVGPFKAEVETLKPHLDAIGAGETAQEKEAIERFTAGATDAIAELRRLADELSGGDIPQAGTVVNIAATLAENQLKNKNYQGTYNILIGIPELLDPVLDYSKTELEALRPEIEAAEKELQEGAKLLAQGEQELVDGQNELNDGWRLFKDGKATLDAVNAQLIDGKRQLEEGRKELAEAEKQLADGKKEYRDGFATAGEEFAKAEKELYKAQVDIQDGERRLDELGEPGWYVFDRDANPGYASFTSDAGRVDAIAKIFPVFFFLVAALISLTTMTRMVEEQRTQIGTFKALGIGPGAIAFKYIFYAGTASLSGSIFGVVLSSYIFPLAIWEAYRMIYVLPSLVVTPQWVFMISSVAASVLVTTIATVAACYNELRSVPAVLMRPKTPKVGKRILMERITPLWKRLSFSQKVTMRNLFRYKRRFILTVIGVAGCTALLLTGLGLRDSISGVVDLQFGEINQYDVVATLSETSDSTEDTDLNRRLDEFGDGVYLEQSNLNAKKGALNNAGMGTYLYSFEDGGKAPEFVDMHTRKGKKHINFPGAGDVVITEKLADLLELEVGDSFDINRDEETPQTVRVSGVMENYIANYVYMSAETHEALFGSAPEYNTLLLKMNDKAKAQPAATLDRLLGVHGIAGAMDIHDFRVEMDDMMNSLNSVVWLIVVSAGALAFVVLYNLTNINITERYREIATLKVLGFYDREVALYVYRENIILTLIGIAFGLFGGVFLHRFVIRVAEDFDIMFQRVVSPVSFLWAALFTFASAMLVNIVMLRKLRNIDMVESLKSAE